MQYVPPADVFPLLSSRAIKDQRFQLIEKALCFFGVHVCHMMHLVRYASALCLIHAVIENLD